MPRGEAGDLLFCVGGIFALEFVVNAFLKGKQTSSWEFQAVVAGAIVSFAAEVTYSVDHPLLVVTTALFVCFGSSLRYAVYWSALYVYCALRFAETVGVLSTIDIAYDKRLYFPLVCIATLFSKLLFVKYREADAKYVDPSTKRRHLLRPESKRRSRQRSRHILGVPGIGAGESPEKALLDSIAEGEGSPAKSVDLPKLSAEGERKAVEAVEAVVDDGNERQALVNLFLATRGECWSKKKGWLTKADIADWEGVTLNDEGKVAQLDLGENNLRGALPQSFGVMTQLTGIYFDTNFISGHIPQSIAQCKSLRDMYLNNNSLTGPLPPGICGLVLLEVLNVESNELSGDLPEGLGEMKRLECLDVRWNHLTGAIPQSICRCLRLEEIWMQGNQLEGKIPASLAKLPRLEWLGLSNNNFEDRDAARLMFQGQFGSEVGIFLDGDGKEFKGGVPKVDIRGREGGGGAGSGGA
jgi:hypothetical protein